jgi:succinyl-diaminopimelate desuccinylase
MIPSLIAICGLALMAVSRVVKNSPEEDRIDAIIGRDAGDLITAVQELVRIRSVAGDPAPDAPFGPGPAEALRKALEIAAGLGFRTVNMDNYIGYAEYGDGDEYVAVLGHLDTVPEGGNWTYTPFGGELHEGRIYGRGALDDKGPALAALFGLKAVMESGLPLSRRVRVMFGTNEETGSLDVRHYLSREKPPAIGFTPDADFPVVFAEKGILWITFEKTLSPYSSGPLLRRMGGGIAVNMVPDEAFAELRTEHPEDLVRRCADFSRSTGYTLRAEHREEEVMIRSEGVSAHASTPEKGKNAIMQLIAFLATLDPGYSDTFDAIRFFNQCIGMETGGSSFGLGISDMRSGALTLNAGKIEITDTLFRLTIDIRYPVTFHREAVMDRVNIAIRRSGFSVTIGKYDPPLYHPVDSPLIQALAEVYRRCEGDETPPVAIGGGTYARRLPHIVAFGPYRPGQKLSIHSRDECVTRDELIADARIYAHAIYALAKELPSPKGGEIPEEKDVPAVTPDEAVETQTPDP